jgi:hypothetical protein
MLKMNALIDKNYLGYYLLQRADNVESYYLSIKNQFGYLGVELNATLETITPLYKYALVHDGDQHTSFKAKEASLSLRYAFGERTSPVFGKYYATGSKYPVVYAKVIHGELTTTNEAMISPYTQALCAITYNKHINRLGKERLILRVGKSFNDPSLPLSKLFAGSGFRYGSTDKFTTGLYAFGGLITMYPFGYYTDQFVNFIYRHDFDRKLYYLPFKGSGISSAPNVGLQYGVLYGTLSNRSQQQYVTFNVPDNAYHEVGLMLNSLLRIKYLNIYYITLNAGYFSHLHSSYNATNDGKLAVGIDIEF